MHLNSVNVECIDHSIHLRKLDHACSDKNKQGMHAVTRTHNACAQGICTQGISQEKLCSNSPNNRSFPRHIKQPRRQEQERLFLTCEYSHADAKSKGASS